MFKIEKSILEISKENGNIF